ncbi:hypothetical protein HN018_17190 [Lichenicola cladoniae]|uniref:Lipoprotein n=1 Tax=Lichenicola cladoniae TaxID=1484109 RepID=A0A6M8HT48_9PROT|nr:hypothetical protein [Lichenicola cladoniae]NPD65382.1 hypothetical protein [Acetobacteraceae bacterium]QKE91538.1 hypothetical protein HN018_17190 [Lichenicola cladoniae]
MMKSIIAGTIGIVCLLGITACDNTYTPSMHHQDAASTGSMLSGTDTGVNANGNTNDPSITSNLGGPHGTH